MNAKVTMLIVVISLVVSFVPINQVQAREGYILQDEFAGLLFERLELVNDDVIMTKQQRIDSLVDLKLAPDEGFAIGEKLTLHQLVITLIRVYSLEDNISKPYSHDEAFDLLVKKGILEETDKLEVYVLYIKAVIILNGIPASPGHSSGNLSIRNPRPPASPID